MPIRTNKIKKKIESILSNYQEYQLSVGWFKDAKYEDGTPVASVAAQNEFGTLKVPARPFIRPAIEDNKSKWKSYIKYFFEEGKGTEYVLNGIGEVISSDIKQKIEEVHSPELSPITLILRKWRREGRKITLDSVSEAITALKNGEGYSGVPTKPLIDTGYMIASLTSVVIKK